MEYKWNINYIKALLSDVRQKMLKDIGEGLHYQEISSK